MNNLIIFISEEQKSSLKAKLTFIDYNSKFVTDAKQFKDTQVKSVSDVFVLQYSFFKSFAEIKKQVELLRSKFPDNKIFLISEKGDIKNIFELLKLGVSDFIETPFSKRKIEELLLKISGNLSGYESREIYKLIEDELSIAGNSKLFKALMHNISEVYEADAPVIIVGELGSEKFKMAHFLHNHGRFSLGKLVRSNISGFVGVENIIADEIIKLSTKAIGGTLILEEVNQFAEGADKFLSQVIDIYHREKLDQKLNLIFTFSLKEEDDCFDSEIGDLNILNIPALRQLKEDIPDMVTFRMKKLAANYAVDEVSVDDSALATFQSYDWPGNLFELSNLVDSLFIKAVQNKQVTIDETSLPKSLTLGQSVADNPEANFEIMSSDLKKARAIFESQYISAQIKRFGGNISQTAAFIGMERTALHRKLISLGIDSDFLRKSIRGEK